jgi:hypothetical protein
MTVLGAQSLYIASLVFISTLISFALGLIVGGTYFETILIGDRYLSLPSALLVIAVQTILLVLFVCIVNAICSLTSLSIRNRYVLQALPLCGFTLLPFVLCSTIANIYPAIGKILLPFIPFAFSQCVMDSLNTNMSTDAFIKIIIPLAVYLATALALRHKNIKTNENGYV